MQRFAAVWHASPQKMVGVLFALLLAAMMAVGSGANFNSTSANPGNMITAGTLSHTNSKQGSAILTVDKLKPGGSDEGTVQITNTGDIDGVFSVARTITSDPTGFAAHLKLTIAEDVAGATPLYSGLLSDMTGAKGADVIAANGTKTYKFTVTFVDANAANPALPNGADNAFKGAVAKTRFDWEAVNN